MEDADLRRFGWAPGDGVMYCANCDDLCTGAAEDAFHCQFCAEWLRDVSQTEPEAQSGFMEATA